MKRIKLKLLVVLGLLVLLVSSCTVQSLFPLFKEKDLIFDENLLGSWDMNGEIWTFEEEIEKNEDGSLNYKFYKLTVVEETDTAVLDVHLLSLGKYKYLDFYMQIDEKFSMIECLTLLPVHAFARTEIRPDLLRVDFFDPDFISDLIEEKKIRIKHVETDDSFVVTASTEELQEFVIKYQDDRDLLSEDGYHLHIYNNREKDE